jgi:hypothetical protein
VITFDGGHTAFDARHCEWYDAPDPAACRDCGAVEPDVRLVTVQEEFYGSFEVCERPIDCQERQEENSLPFWQWMNAR